MSKNRLNIIVITGLAVLTLAGLSPQWTRAELDYDGMVKQIGTFFSQALEQYKLGNTQEAKLKAQAAYFEVFENLEGPIRINISAKKNFVLESEFTGIRKMIVAKEPYEAIEKRVNDLMAELDKVAGQLKGGHVLKAEGTDEAHRSPSEQEAAHAAPVGSDAVTKMQADLDQALAAYRAGDAEKARSMLIRTQSEESDKAQREAAGKSHVSETKDSQNLAGFASIQEMMRKGEPAEKVAAEISLLKERLNGELPGPAAAQGVTSTTDASKTEQKDIPNVDWAGVATKLRAEIGKAIAVYEKGEAATARSQVQDTYFDVFEASGMEARIGAMDPAFKAKLESHFTAMASQMKKGLPVAEVRTTFQAMETDLDHAVNMLGKAADSPWTLFFYSLLIIVREGFEAILIITAIIAFLVKTGNQDKLRVIYNGVIVALLLSVVTAVLVKWVFKASAASQEVLEGITMLVASVVLFSVSYWLVSKAEAQKWMSYIQKQVSESLSTGSIRTLWFAAFLAVYREGAETVLFYQALMAGQSSSGITMCLIGFGVGSVLLVVIYLVMRYGAVKLPIRPFFMVTSAVIYYMAFVFAGKGVMELIEGKVISPSLVSWFPTIPMLGVYPYWETLLPQIALFIAALIGIAVAMKQPSGAVREAHH
jgi:high-affinity iron transporter